MGDIILSNKQIVRDAHDAVFKAEQDLHDAMLMCKAARKQLAKLVRQLGNDIRKTFIQAGEYAAATTRGTPLTLSQRGLVVRIYTRTDIDTICKFITDRGWTIDRVIPQDNQRLIHEIHAH